MTITMLLACTGNPPTPPSEEIAPPRDTAPYVYVLPDPCPVEPCVADLAESSLYGEDEGLNVGFQLYVHNNTLYASALNHWATPTLQPAYVAAYALDSLQEIGRVETGWAGAQNFDFCMAFPTFPGDEGPTLLFGDSEYSEPEGRIIAAELPLDAGVNQPAWTVVGGDGEKLGCTVLMGDWYGTGESTLLGLAVGSNIGREVHAQLWHFAGHPRSTQATLHAPFEEPGNVWNLFAWDHGADQTTLGLMEGSSLLLRTLSDPKPFASWSTPESSETWYGARVARHDVDLDGTEDLIFSHNLHSEDALRAGRVYIATEVPGIADDPDALPIQFRGQADGDGLGQSMALGDANGDGIVDLAIGGGVNPGIGNPSTTPGTVRIFFGPLEGIKTASEADITVWGEQVSGCFGCAIVLHDTDGDGKDDLIASERSWNQESGAIHTINANTLLEL